MWRWSAGVGRWFRLSRLRRRRPLHRKARRAAFVSVQRLPQADVHQGWNYFRLRQAAAAPLVQSNLSRHPIEEGDFQHRACAPAWRHTDDCLGDEAQAGVGHVGTQCQQKLKGKVQMDEAYIGASVQAGLDAARQVRRRSSPRWPRRTMASRIRSFCGHPRFAELALFRIESRLGPSRARMAAHLRPPDHRHQLLEQLRTLSFPEKLIPLMIFNAIEGKPLPVFGRGENIRDWLYVEDHAAALMLVARQGSWANPIMLAVAMSGARSMWFTPSAS